MGGKFGVGWVIVALVLLGSGCALLFSEAVLWTITIAVLVCGSFYALSSRNAGNLDGTRLSVTATLCVLIPMWVMYFLLR